MDAWDEYTEAVMDHYEHPRNVGVVENPDGVGIVGNPACGDVMKLTILWMPGSRPSAAEPPSQPARW
jgi:NifU-like protein involved in Fe-S cluster formation